MSQPSQAGICLWYDKNPGIILAEMPADLSAVARSAEEETPIYPRLLVSLKLRQNGPASQGRQIVFGGVYWKKSKFILPAHPKRSENGEEFIPHIPTQ